MSDIDPSSEESPPSAALRALTFKDEQQRIISLIAAGFAGALLLVTVAEVLVFELGGSEEHFSHGATLAAVSINVFGALVCGALGLVARGAMGARKLRRRLYSRLLYLAMLLGILISVAHIAIAGSQSTLLVMIVPTTLGLATWVLPWRGVLVLTAVAAVAYVLVVAAELTGVLPYAPIFGSPPMLAHIFLDWRVILGNSMFTILLFGGLLVGLHRFHQQLTAHRDSLEDRVRERTRALEASNAALQRQIAASQAQTEALREAEQSYRTVADFTYDWEVWEGSDGSIRYVSPSCERITGYAAAELEADAGLMDRMIVAEDRPPWAEHLSRRDSEDEGEDRGALQFRIRRKDGGIRWIEHRCQPVREPDGHYMGIRASNRDITLSKTVEAQLTQHRSELARVARVASLGELTASIAHELNQPLAAILSNAQAARRFLHRDEPDLEEVGDALGDIIEDDRRAAQVIQRLRVLLSGGEAERLPIDLNEIVRDVAQLLTNEASLVDARLRTMLGKGPLTVRGDGVQLQQVVLNLIVNAFDAVRRQPRDEREVTVRTWRNDSLIFVEVRDSGPGLPAGQLDRIFEPFVSTKEQGLGIGLALSRRIIESHGGRIRGGSSEEGGAVLTFSIGADAG